MKSTVSEKGQVTIPKALRISLALRPGTELEFFEDDGKLVARRVDESDGLSGLVGLIARMDVDAALDRLRGPGFTKDLDERRHDHRRR